MSVCDNCLNPLSQIRINIVSKIPPEDLAKQIIDELRRWEAK